MTNISKISVLVIIIIGFVLFNNFNEITGFTIYHTEEEDEVIGTYSINPNFKVNIDYDLFGEYEKVVEYAKEFQLCQREPIWDDCIDKKIEYYNRINEKLKTDDENKKTIDWERDCDPQEETFFYEFVDFYRFCLESPSDEAICTLQLKDIPKDSKYEIKISHLNDKTKIELVGKPKEEIIDVNGPFMYRYVDLAKLDKEKVFEFKTQDTEDNRGDHKTSISINIEPDTKYTISSQEINKYTIDTKEIILYKGTENKKPFVSFIHIEAYEILKIKKNEERDKIKFPITITPIKDTFKFCAKSDYKFHIYNEKTNKVELKNIEYKFALKFQDTIPPPPVEDINIRDKLNDDSSLLVTWDKSPAQDVNDYIIYYSEKDFKDEEISDIELDPEIIKIEVKEQEKIELDEIYLEECKFDPIGKPCKYKKTEQSTNYDTTLKKDSLYFLKDKNKYLYVLSNIENKKYNFMVVALDLRLNKIDNKKDDEKFKLIDGKLPSGESIDDLSINSKDLVTEVRYDSYQQYIIKYNLNIKIQNIDGSDTEDFDHYDIYYSILDSTNPDEFRSKAKTITNEPLNKMIPLVSFTPKSNVNTYSTETIEKTPGKIYYYIGVAVDKNQNPNPLTTPIELGIETALHDR